MKKSLHLLFTACLFLSAGFAAAQSCCEIKRSAGQKAFDKGDYDTAISKWTEGKSCSDASCTDFNALIARAKQKKDARKRQEQQDREEAAARQEFEKNEAARLAADDSFWEALKDGDIADCEKYLKKYPFGRHTAEARRRKESLNPKPASPANSAPSNGTTAFRDCPECPVMIPVPGGSYTMGSTPGEKDECPHTETVASFSIGKYEVTVEEYLRFADATQSHYPEWLEKDNANNVETGSNNYYKEKGYSRTAKNLPVCGVSWDDATAYCNWLSQKTGKKYRLPLEKEWEYAAKGGKKSQNYTYSGSNSANDVAWNDSNSGGKPHAIGGLAANELSIYDMSGNLWEWCQNQWAPYPDCTADECTGCAVLRGGSWYHNYTYCRSAFRDRSRVNNQTSGVGFRCSRDGE